MLMFGKKWVECFSFQRADVLSSVSCLRVPALLGSHDPFLGAGDTKISKIRSYCIDSLGEFV